MDPRRWKRPLNSSNNDEEKEHENSTMGSAQAHVINNDDATTSTMGSAQAHVINSDDAATLGQNPTVSPLLTLSLGVQGNERTGVHFRGVKQRSSGTWTAEIKIPYKEAKFCLGTFNTPECAAMASDHAARMFQGTKAELNFPERVQGRTEATSPNLEKNAQPLQNEGQRSRVHFRGVRKTASGNWGADIKHPEKAGRLWLGTYDTPEAAAMAYDEAALSFQGAKAKLNFPERDQERTETTTPDLKKLRQSKEEDLDSLLMLQLGSSSSSSSSVASGSWSQAHEKK